VRNVVSLHILIVVVPWLVGCGRLVFTPSPQAATVSLTPQQQQALAMQTQQFQTRATQLDRNNQELEAMLAQSRQQMQLLQDQLAATQGQLRDTASQLAATQGENQELQTRAVAMAASIQRQTTAEIRPNNSLVRNLSITNLPGVEVRPDGDVIRVELPGDQLFYPGSPQLKPAAISLLQTVGTDILRNYPQQLVGIEGHTDNTPPASPQYPTAHHLSVARAMAVYDALTRSVGATPQQFFVIGHGANHPIMTNATDAGRARNNRVELVVYPESLRR
jgi:flagellar motor protein MotB